MSAATDERLYNLLPAVYRVRDVEEGEPLRALCAVLERELLAVEADVGRLYDNWFIETCDEWVVPYIGDLLGARPLHPIGSGAVSLRAYVANVLAYRRRKGTAAVLEQLARDVTAWPARAVEFFQLLATTQHLNHLRLHNLRTPDLRDTAALELLGGPFERAAHALEVRRIESRRGRYNIPNLGLFLWRLRSYPIVPSGSVAETGRPGRGTARKVGAGFTFSPLGHDEAPLFNRPQTETEITHLAEEINVPACLRRRSLYDELEALRQALASDEPPPRPRYFGEAQPVLEVYTRGRPEPVPPQNILICDLGDWSRPDAERVYIRPDGTEVGRPIQVAVDPVRGRLTFPKGARPFPVLVSYSYGFSADLGGGPYDRRESVNAALNRPVAWGVAVSREHAAIDGKVFPNLRDAIQAWNEAPKTPATMGVIAILDSLTYDENLTGASRVNMPPGSRLLIVAADWPQAGSSNSPEAVARFPAEVTPVGRRPHLLGNVNVKGEPPVGDESAGELVIDGLLIEGRLTVRPGHLGGLHLAHSTLVPDSGGLLVKGSTTEGTNSQLNVSIQRSICGPIGLPDMVPELHVRDSIVEAADGSAIVAPDAEVEVQSSTVFGPTRARTLEADNSIFTGPLDVELRQVGCMRFCSLPDRFGAPPRWSRTPRRYRCQPDLALEGVDESDHHLVRIRLAPVFTSTAYGDPGYAQLGRTCPNEIRTGADDGSEMGAFSHLRQPQREANLRSTLDEYLPIGLEAGIFYVT